MVQIKHKCELSNPIKVCTRQSGLSSPFLFNLFYQERVESLADCTRGITINGFGLMLTTFCLLV